MREKDLQIKIQRGCGGEKRRLEKEADFKSEIGKSFGEKDQNRKWQNQKQRGSGRGRHERDKEDKTDRQTDESAGDSVEREGFGAGRWRGGGGREGGS